MQSFQLFQWFHLTETEKQNQKTRPQNCHLNQSNALTVVTSSVDLQWAVSLNDLRNQGVEVAVVLVDRSSFGSTTDMQIPLEVLTANLIPTYLVRKGDVLNDVLRTPIKEMPRRRTTRVDGRQ